MCKRDFAAACPWYHPQKCSPKSVQCFWVEFKGVQCLACSFASCCCFGSSLATLYPMGNSNSKKHTTTNTQKHTDKDTQRQKNVTHTVKLTACLWSPSSACTHTHTSKQLFAFTCFCRHISLKKDPCILCA